MAKVRFLFTDTGEVGDDTVNIDVKTVTPPEDGNIRSSLACMVASLVNKILKDPRAFEEVVQIMVDYDEEQNDKEGATA